jgi:hypothetical protein
MKKLRIALYTSVWLRGDESSSHSATQEFPNFLWNPKVHYHVRKSPLLVPATHTTPSRCLDISHLRIGLRNGLFGSAVYSKTLCIPLCFHACYTPCPSHPHYTSRWVEVMKLIIYPVFYSFLFHPPSVHIFSALWPQTSAACVLSLMSETEFKHYAMKIYVRVDV